MEFDKLKKALNLTWEWGDVQYMMALSPEGWHILFNYRTVGQSKWERGLQPEHLMMVKKLMEDAGPKDEFFGLNIS